MFVFVDFFGIFFLNETLDTYLFGRLEYLAIENVSRDTFYVRMGGLRVLIIFFIHIIAQICGFFGALFLWLCFVTKRYSTSFVWPLLFLLRDLLYHKILLLFTVLLQNKYQESTTSNFAWIRWNLCDFF